MSYTRVESRDAAPPKRLADAPLVRLSSVVAWAVINAGLLFAEQVAELLAPLVLLAGALWWAVPHALDAIKLDGAPGDMLLQLRARLPMTFDIAGQTLTPHVLLTDGLLCIAVVAICRTLSHLATVLLLDRR